MRIVFLAEWYSSGMGYAENQLTKAMASLGPEVHLVTSNAQVYFNSPTYKETYESFLGPPIVECGTSQVDGYTLHRLPFSFIRHRYLTLNGLRNKLQEIQPDIVHNFDVTSYTNWQLLWAKCFVPFKLFLECHTHASVFPLAKEQHPKLNLPQNIRKTVGRLLGIFSEKCYPISIDSGDIAHRFYGIPSRKMEIVSLGVDTELFHPVRTKEDQQARETLRVKLGVTPEEILCIYTGRFSPSKHPLCLAQAVTHARQLGHPVRGLFVGGGEQEQQILANDGNIVQSWVKAKELPGYYRAADIGVWPREESTSQLDAASCGLPLIISDGTQVPERIDGNGLVYKHDDAQDLAQQILRLNEPARRKNLGHVGREKVEQNYSWKSIAQYHLERYRQALPRSRQAA